MLSPVTRALIKIFGKGFFRANAGLLVFLFVMLISYCFFMNTVGDVKLISAQQLTYYHFIIVINFISSPIITIGVLLIWLVYSIKSWGYIIGQLAVPNNQFLYYSISSASKLKQFKSWLGVQFFIFIPIIGYWLFAAVFGLIFRHYVLPAIILIYILLLLAISGMLYVYLIHQQISGSQQTVLIRLSQKWQKPYFSLFIYQVCDKMKLHYVIVKLLSYLIITATFFAFDDAYHDMRVAAIVMLLLTTAHSVIIYRHHQFEETRLSFSRNLGYNRRALFFSLPAIYFVLIMPECIWLFTKHSISIAIPAFFLGVSVLVLFRSILYWLGLHMNRYLPYILLLFVGLFWMILFGYLISLIILNLMSSVLIFYSRYYRYEAVLK